MTLMYCITQYCVVHCIWGDEMAIEDWKTQAKKGILELCVLSLIEYKDHYGYELIESLSKWESMSTNENTVYPLLRRLTKEGYLEGYWVENEVMPRRKYYKLTSEGEVYLLAMRDSWNKLVNDVAGIKNIKENHNG